MIAVILTDEVLRRWRALAETTMMVSALGEYTPEEFLILLNEVERLRAENDELRKQIKKGK